MLAMGVQPIALHAWLSGPQGYTHGSPVHRAAPCVNRKRPFRAKIWLFSFGFIHDNRALKGRDMLAMGAAHRFVHFYQCTEQEIQGS